MFLFLLEVGVEIKLINQFIQFTFGTDDVAVHVFFSGGSLFAEVMVVLKQAASFPLLQFALSSRWMSLSEGCIEVVGVCEGPSSFPFLLSARWMLSTEG